MKTTSVIRGRQFAAALLAGAAILVAAATADAQPLRPNILIIFDTSGSMTDHDIHTPAAYHDGSPLCAGIGDGSNPADPNDFTRRIYGLKRAIRETLAQVGTDEANFGLMRFPQLEDPARTPVCMSDTFEADPANGRHWASRYYQDGNTAVPNPANAADQLFGCRISTQDRLAPQTTFGDGSWFRAGLSQTLLVPVTKGSAALPTAGDLDPPGANITSIARWMDLQEASDGTTITDPELRSGNYFFTPLGRSIFYGGLYYKNIVEAVDPRVGCRKNIIILVTDGKESCDKTGPFEPVSQAAAFFAAGKVGGKNLHDLYVVTDRNVCDATGCGLNDEIAKAGGNGRIAIPVDFTNSNNVKQALVSIIAEAVPPSEICNGADDNCNGQIDELPLPGVGGACLCPGLTEANVGRGMCKKGALVCTGAGGIACQGCVAPGVEVCNGIDDDCDGQIDEGFNLGQACDNGQKGACLKYGRTVCSPDQTGVVCNAPTGGPPSAEVCNRIDDDCNGIVDDPPAGGMLPGEGEDCGAKLGVCMAGKTRCDKGQLVCTGGSGTPLDEVCDGQDNNCNGQVDEKTGGGPCACGAFTLAQLSVGECRPGTQVCRGVAGLQCEGCVLPAPEECNGKDDNCDGKVDEGDDICHSPTRICVSGRCEPKCTEGEFRCPIGYECVDADATRAYCRSTKCLNKVCDPGTGCDPVDGVCKDLCAGVQCTAPSVCRASDGQCVDCFTTGCPTGQQCVRGACRVDLCANVSCAPTDYCDSGKCISTCPAGCPTGQRCVAGACQADLCGSRVCKVGEVCNPADGTCAPNACSLKASCPVPGQRCVPVSGGCKDDPCGSVRCPACSECRMTVDGLATCAVTASCQGPGPAPEVRTVVRVGGKGCGCTVGGAPREPEGLAATFALGLGLVFASRLRRARRKALRKS